MATGGRENRSSVGDYLPRDVAFGPGNDKNDK